MATVLRSTNANASLTLVYARQTSRLQIEAALTYARRHQLEACLIQQGPKLLAEVYEAGFERKLAHPLFSGTKSFWGPAAVRAQQDGLLTLDEAAGETIAAWRRDPIKKEITIRMLLSLTAGYGFGGLGASVPTFDRAIDVALKDKPGTKFTYGGIPLQIFGAILTRKLAAQRMTPHDYLAERILKPAGVAVASWRKLNDGSQPLPTGAFLTARQWLKYGLYISDQHSEFGECFKGSAANARYGLGWWLGLKGAPEDLFYASGSGGQAMYVIPSLGVTIVHFGKSASYKHEAFVRQLFSC